MRTTLNAAKKKWPSKRRWYVKKWFTIEDIKRTYRKNPAQLLAMKRARLWVRNRFGAVI